MRMWIVMSLLRYNRYQSFTTYVKASSDTQDALFLVLYGQSFLEVCYRKHRDAVKDVLNSLWVDLLLVIMSLKRVETAFTNGRWLIANCENPSRCALVQGCSKCQVVDRSCVCLDSWVIRYFVEEGRIFLACICIGCLACKICILFFFCVMPHDV